MIKESSLPVSAGCSVLDVSRDAFYSWLKNPYQKEKDLEITGIIHEIASDFPRYGYRRVTAELHRRNIIINNKKVLRIMRQENLLCRRKKGTPVTTNSAHSYQLYPNLVKNCVVTGLNQVWAADITYVEIEEGFIYLASILDLFSRKCIGWELGRNIDAQLALNALCMAVKERKHLGLSCLIHHSDRGVQYASKLYVDFLKQNGIAISMCETGNPRENAYAESFFKTVKYEEVYLREYRTFREAFENIKTFIEDVYNARRLHSSIGYMPPAEFEQKILNRTGLA
jgi:transposase InsO family protein